MQRTRIDLAQLATVDNLALAASKAAAGKRQRREVARFFAQFDESVARLRRDILAAAVPYGEYRRFLIHDPKKRLIHAACFADRVLHHAIMNLAEPVFERTLVPSSYACRPGLGVHRAIRQGLAGRRERWPTLEADALIGCGVRGSTFRGALRLAPRGEPGKRNDNVGFRLALAPESRRPAQDQMNFLSAALRRQKANALRQAGRRYAEGLPKRRLAEFR